MNYLKYTVLLTFIAIACTSFEQESNFINEHVTYTARRSIVSIMHIEFQQLCIGALIGPYWILYSKRCMQFVKKELENYYALIGVAGHALGGRHYFAGQYSIKKPFNFGVLNLTQPIHLHEYLKLSTALVYPLDIGGVSLAMTPARQDMLFVFPHIKLIGNELFPRSHPGIYSKNNVPLGSLLMQQGRLVGVAQHYASYTYVTSSEQSQPLTCFRFDPFTINDIEKIRIHLDK